MTLSASLWKASDTILLLSNPGFKDDRKPALSIGTETHIDVDPHMDDACWLRGFAQKLTKREHVNQPFPEDGTFPVSFREGEHVLKCSSIRRRRGCFL